MCRSIFDNISNISHVFTFVIIAILPWLDNLFSSLDYLFSYSRNGISAVNYLMKRLKSFISLVTDFQDKEVNKLNLAVIIIKFEKLHPTVATGRWQKMLLILHTFFCVQVIFIMPIWYPKLWDSSVHEYFLTISH